MEIQKKMVQSYSEPENTHVIWLDSNDNKLKTYQNGSWQLLMEDNKYYVDAITLMNYYQSLNFDIVIGVISDGQYAENEEYTPDMDNYNAVMYVIKTVFEIKKQFDLGKRIYGANIEILDISSRIPATTSNMLLRYDDFPCSYVCSDDSNQEEYINNIIAGNINQKEFLKNDFEEVYLNTDETEESLKTIPEEYKFSNFVIKFNNSFVLHLGWIYYGKPAFCISLASFEE